MQPIRQGDVILVPVGSVAGEESPLPHLILAFGESGHKHQITTGVASLSERDGVMYLSVLSPQALLSHEEHQAIAIPHGTWMVKIQREYEPKGWRYVAD
ncbi:MAG: hypothetical protein H0X31_03350 [Nostocaceae cyanobacterium]|nr:hypothetical protein [Nostocaceae cyanobacterium]